jgi:molybdopterin converting factor small subunit
VDLPDGATVGDLLKRLGIPDGMAALLLVNGTHQPPETVLKDGETLAMFPPLAGGARPGSDCRLTIFD